MLERLGVATWGSRVLESRHKPYAARTCGRLRGSLGVVLPLPLNSLGQIVALSPFVA
jgi:hypothetical protein